MRDQQSGTWAVEANTATEVSFKTAGMDELDPSTHRCSPTTSRVITSSACSVT